MSPDQLVNTFNVNPLEFIPLWLMYVIIVIVLLLAIEGGYQLSKYLQRRRSDRAEAVVGTLNGATLALLAFLLAFVTSSSVSSLSSRRLAVVAEANAIGTTYLRAGYLPDPIGAESRELLREYIDQRLAASEGDISTLATALIRSEEIHTELWLRAEALARAESSPTTALYVSALNEVIDLHTERINAGLVARTPWSLILGLFLIAVLALTILGLHAGYAENRNPVATIIFVLILGVVFLLIVDLGRSQEGLLQVSNQSLIDLQRQVTVDVNN